jgi:hypothetical protein
MLSIERDSLERYLQKHPENRNYLYLVVGEEVDDLETLIRDISEHPLTIIPPLSSEINSLETLFDIPGSFARLKLYEDLGENSVSRIGRTLGKISTKSTYPHPTDLIPEGYRGGIVVIHTEDDCGYDTSDEECESYRIMFFNLFHIADGIVFDYMTFMPYTKELIQDFEQIIQRNDSSAVERFISRNCQNVDSEWFEGFCGFIRDFIVEIDPQARIENMTITTWEYMVLWFRKPIE